MSLFNNEILKYNYLNELAQDICLKLTENRSQWILHSLQSVRYYAYSFPGESLPSTGINLFSGIKRKKKYSKLPPHIQCILQHHWGFLGTFLDTFNSTLSTEFSIVPLRPILYTITFIPSVSQSTAHICKPLLKFRV